MKLFNSSLPKPNALAILLAVASCISLTAHAAPSGKKGNRGVPGRINELETQINDQNATIEELQAILDALQNALTPAPVPQSGMTESFAAGDDGDVQAGVALPDPRFTDNLDGTVTDNLTGLIWLQDASCDSFGPSANGIGEWQEVLDAANLLMDGECGLSDGSIAGDWRMPNINELQSLIDYRNLDPALTTGAPFVDVQSAGYWSSTTIPSDPRGAWGVDLLTGISGADTKAFDNYVWPVRDAQ